MCVDQHLEPLELVSFAHPDVVAGGPVDQIQDSGLNKGVRDYESDNLADFMGFSVTDVAEQLTRMDAVSASFYCLLLYDSSWSYRLVMLVFLML